MRRRPPITALALAAVLASPVLATAQTPAQLLAEATPLRSPAQLLADATPLREALPPQDAEPLTDTPIANRDGVLLADSGDPQQLLAQAPSASATPPAGTLPHTGVELLLTLLTGIGLVLAGAGLRLRVPVAER